MTFEISQLLAYTLPSVITGAVAYYLFDAHFKDQQNTRKWLLQKDNKTALLPQRLQAFERMTLFVERMNPAQLLVRIAPDSNNDKAGYANLVIAHIEQEFEHNLSQQIYLSNQCWSVIVAAKNATNQIIRTAAANVAVNTAEELREKIIKDSLEKAVPSGAAIAFIKDEVSQLW